MKISFDTENIPAAHSSVAQRFYQLRTEFLDKYGREPDCFVVSEEQYYELLKEVNALSYYLGESLMLHISKFQGIPVYLPSDIIDMRQNETQL